MLDRSKLVAELQSLAHLLFVTHDSGIQSAQEAWSALVQDPDFFHKVIAVDDAPWPVPLWEGDVGDIFHCMQLDTSYVACSVDGSQIYPDRHNILSCCLINVGSIVVPYAIPDKQVLFSSEPTVFAGTDEHQVSYTVESINCKRQELELVAGLALGKRLKNEYAGYFSPLFFDGSLIFWHLLSKEHEVRDLFLGIYFSLLEQLYQESIISLWYISMPKSKELMSLIRLYLSDFDHSKKDLYSSVDSVLDSGVMQSYLPFNTRSTVFCNRSAISAYYPQHLKPHFFYIHTQGEIGRVEIPAWIARDKSLVDMIASSVIDQCVKGNGYPVVLAEAHEQAVVKGHDRDFFYHYLQKMGIEQKQKIVVSRKSLQKRGMGI